MHVVKSEVDLPVEEEILHLTICLALREVHHGTPNRMKGRLAVFCGTSGSGKTTIAKLLVKYFGDSILIETDSVRKVLAHPIFSTDESEFVYNARFAIAKEALKAGYVVLLDGTFLREEHRTEARRVFRKYYERADTVWAWCELETALERNSASNAVVPAVKVKAMYGAFEAPRVAVRVDSSGMTPESGSKRIVLALTR